MTESWMQLFTVIIANFGITWAFRRESREDWKMMHEDNKRFSESVRVDIKDFHERLLEIEKTRKK